MTDENIPPKTVQNYRVLSGASQFYWIAGFSVVNSVLNALDVNAFFPIGLGISELLAELGALSTLSGRIGAWLGVMLLLGIMLLCGYFGRKGELWAFILGGAIYLLDVALWLMVGDWIAAIFHVWFLYFIIRGVLALRKTP
jgi:hypothetical protein